VLAAQYESFRDPFIILIALPTSIFGALLPLNLGLATINIYTQIGLVCLIGLIAKHGILMVDFANKLQEEEGFSRADAIEHAAAIRLRPILMTTAATVVAMVPLLIASGAGAAARFNIGIIIAAGMTIGTLFTLFVTPTVYTYLARDHQKVRARQEAEAAASGERPPPAEKAPTKEETKGIDAATDAGVPFPSEPDEEAKEAPAKTGKTAPARKRARRKPRTRSSGGKSLPEAAE
jgi:multidrug efflux pump